MPEQHLFEYAVIRVVPKVEREEFLNVGVILLCSGKKFLQTLFALDEARLQAFSCTIETAELQEHIRSFEEICKGGSHGGAIGKLPLAERFRWLTATRSTILQTSKVHPGLCDDPHEMLLRLHAQLVLLDKQDQ